MLCDQPLIPMQHYYKLIQSIEKEPLRIVASSYSSKLSVPAIFPPIHKQELMRLQTDKGAKSILSNNQCIAIYLDKKYAFDIDTREDFAQIKSFF